MIGNSLTTTRWPTHSPNDTPHQTEPGSADVTPETPPPQGTYPFQAALGAGWTVDELRTSGLPEPEKKLRVRKRTTRTKKAQETDPLAERAQQAVDQANQTVHTANEATKKAREELGTAD